jgi:hypothetical protein
MPRLLIAANYILNLARFAALWAVVGALSGFLIGLVLTFYFLEPYTWESARFGLEFGFLFGLGFWLSCDAYFLAKRFNS